MNRSYTIAILCLSDFFYSRHSLTYTKPKSILLFLHYLPVSRWNWRSLMQWQQKAIEFSGKAGWQNFFYIHPCTHMCLCVCANKMDENLSSVNPHKFIAFLKYSCIQSEEKSHFRCASVFFLHGFFLIVQIATLA